MKKPRLTCDSALLLAHRRIALLEARVDALTRERRPPCPVPPPGPGPGRPDELARALWTSAILIVAVVLVMVALMFWGTQV